MLRTGHRWTTIQLVGVKVDFDLHTISDDVHQYIVKSMMRGGFIDLCTLRRETLLSWLERSDLNNKLVSPRLREYTSSTVAIAIASRAVEGRLENIPGIEVSYKVDGYPESCETWIIFYTQWVLYLVRTTSS